MSGFVAPRDTKTKGRVFEARWRDGDGHERVKTFATQRDAKDHLQKLAARQIGGANRSIGWLADEFLKEKLAMVEAGLRERTTYDGYEGHLRLYLKPDELASKKCSEVSRPDVRAYFVRLLKATSPANARKVRVSVSSMFEWGVDAGHLMHNPARRARLEITERHAVDEADDFDGLQVDQITIPTPEQARAILKAADAREAKDKGRAGAQMRLLFHGGLRPSEMLGFPVRGVGVTKGGRVQLKVVQRTDKRGVIGRLKNKKSRRMITLAQAPSLWLRKYMLTAGLPKDGLLFPTRSGRAQLYTNFREDVWARILGAAGYATATTTQRNLPSTRTPDGSRLKKKRDVTLWKPFFSPHDGRHFAASALIAAGCAPKRLQAFLGHETLQVTMDVYGHLFPDQRADEELAEALDAQMRAGETV
jgi:integrase